MGRPSAGERLKRLLALLPWLAAHPGSTIAEISERFGLSPQQLEDDLAVVWMVGVPPYTPDQLIDVEFDGDRVSVNLVTGQVVGEMEPQPQQTMPITPCTTAKPSDAANRLRGGGKGMGELGPLHPRQRHVIRVKHDVVAIGLVARAPVDDLDVDGLATAGGGAGHQA